MLVSLDSGLSAVGLECPQEESQACSHPIIDLAFISRGLLLCTQTFTFYTLFPNSLCRVFADSSVSINSIISLL